MTARPALATAALVVALLVGGAAAVSVVASQWGEEGATPGTMATGGLDGDDAVPSERRERRRVTPVAEPEPAVEPVAAPVVEGVRSTSLPLDAEDARRLHELVRVAVHEAKRAERKLNAHREAQLFASPERDPLLMSDPERVREAPRMDLAAFAAGGVDSVDGAAELVGERRPDMHEGKPAGLTGRVLSQESGEPIAGAQVVVSSTFYVRRHLYDHHLRAVARAFTDADGRYVIPRIDIDPAHAGTVDQLSLTVTAGGYASSRARPVIASVSRITNRVPDVKLATASHTLSGRVLDIWEGAPVAGARVYATGSVDPVQYPKDQRDAIFVGVPTAVTDADGRFELVEVGPGVQVVSIHGGDDCVGRESVVVPREGALVIRTRGIGGRIAGRAVDAFGDPVPLVAVQGGGNSTHSFADGTFVLENFREDELTVVFSHPEYQRVVLSGLADGSEGVEVRLLHSQPRVRIRVRRGWDGSLVKRLGIVAIAASGDAVQATSPLYLADDGVHEVVVPAGAVSLRINVHPTLPLMVDAASAQDGDTFDVLWDPLADE
jgi:protocatechuate 3,4-dioxygenase beta subunit